MRRREAAEEDAHGWRRRAEAAGAAAASTRDEGDRQDSSGRGGGASWRAIFGGREGNSSVADPARRDVTVADGCGSAVDVSSPVGKLKRRFFEAREGGEGAAEAATRASTKPAAPSPFHFERQQAGGGVGGGGDQSGAKGGGARWDQQIPSPALNERPPSSSSITSVATVAGRRPSMDRISRSQPRFAGAHSGQEQHPPRLVSAAAGECYGRVLPSPSSSSSVSDPAWTARLRSLPRRGEGGAGERKKPDTPRLAASPCLALHQALPEGLHVISGEQQQQQLRQQRQMRQRQGVSAPATNGPETPGRPPRPAWEISNGSEKDSGSGDRIFGAGRGGQTSGSGRQASSQLAQQVPHRRRPQRPTAPQAHAADGSGGGVQTGLFSSTTPAPNARAGAGTGGSSRSIPTVSLPGQWSGPVPRSPLLAVRPGASKRPFSGSLPAPKRPGVASAGDRGGGTRPGRRAGTPTPILHTSPSSVQIRSTRLPFTPSSALRPGSGQRPRKTGGTGSSGSSSSTGRKTPTTADGRRAANSVPRSLEAAGLFAKRPNANGGVR